MASTNSEDAIRLASTEPADGMIRLAGTGRTKPRGYIEDYNPSAETRVLLADVQGVLDQYEALLPLTVRQIYYILIGQRGYPKTEQFYERLCSHVSNGRRGRMISFDAIRDDGVAGTAPNHFADKDGFYERVRRMGQGYQRDKLARQAVHLEVWCEAAGMQPQLVRTARQFSVPVYSAGGFDSTTAKYFLAQRICRVGKRAVILHLGDLDPSGVAIFESSAEDVREFVMADRKWRYVDVEFVRVALRPEQVEEFRLERGGAPKKTDSRSGKWPFAWTCQLEALPPDAVASLLRAAITERLDRSIFDEDIALERQERNEIVYSLPSPREDR